MTWSRCCARLVDIESVSGDEAGIADQVERALTRYAHLAVSRDGNVVVARTELGRAERVVVAGHLDTVPIAANVPSWVTNGADGLRVWGRGACDMKGGVAVQLAAAAALNAPNRDVTWIFYDNEEIEEQHNGLRRLAATRPEQLAADFAILCEPSNAQIEGGCQGTLRAEVDPDRAWRRTRPGRGWGTTRSTTPARCCSGWPTTSPRRSRSTG